MTLPQEGTGNVLTQSAGATAVASPKVGGDSFTYTVTDGKASTTGTVNVRVVYGFTNVKNLPPQK